jgi:hypothetical protein
MLSAYHLAEWISWNWWRLRWEPRSRAEDWAFAHRISTIGAGYIWPNITIFSDGQRIALIAKPTAERAQTPFRYISDMAVVIPAVEFEAEIDRFIGQEVLQQLHSKELRNTNLEVLWNELQRERRTPDVARTRKLEALLGRDPDKVEPELISQMILDASQLSASAIEEIAADYGQSRQLLTAGNLRQIAESNGFDESPRNVVRLRFDVQPAARRGEIPAWRVGSNAAKALRQQEGLGVQPIANTRLADMVGVHVDAIGTVRPGPNISFALDDGPQHGKVVLRSKWEQGRRFDLARILGDRLVPGHEGRLFPATRAYTFRQKIQRSFAAELLSPYEAVEEFLTGDYSPENQQDAAEHFNVSPFTIRTLLVNHGRLDRGEMDGDFEIPTAA